MATRNKIPHIKSVETRYLEDRVSLFRGLRNLLVVLAVIAGAIAAYRHAQSDARFAIKRIEVTGAVHTQRAAIDVLTKRYAGLNLFRLDIDRVQRDMTSLEWVARIEIEKSLPDTLRIRIVERTPVALVLSDGPVHYVDDDGVTFAELSTAVGDSDLPVISGARGAELAHCVGLLRDLRARDAQLYARVSEVRPVAPRGFAIFDRELGAFVYADAGDLSAKWRDLYAIVANEKLARGAIEYADLRFQNRIVVKPWRAAATPSPSEGGSSAAALQD